MHEDLLRLQTPETGRRFKEDATILNIADTEFVKHILEQAGL